MFDMKACGERIRSLRDDRKMTQEAVAEELHVSSYHYRRIENGREGVSIDLLIDIAGYYSVSLDYLVLGREGLPQDREELKKNLLLAALLLAQTAKTL